MKKIRLHILIVLAIFLVGIIVGSFVDYQLSNAIFSRNNGFGLFMSAIGTIPGYMILAVLGGGMFTIAFKNKEYKLIWKIILYVAAVALFIFPIYYAGREFFGPNGFYDEKKVWVGYLIALPIASGCGYLGYEITRKSTTPYLWLIYAILAFFIFMSLVPGVSLLKAIFHRPRFRTLTLFDDINFHNWWERCANYKDLMAAHDILSEEFKSFPSGHAGASAVFMLGVSILPIVDNKFKKVQLPLFYVGLCWTLFVSFTRILVGAHFLSDVSMGGLLTSVFMLINNEVIIALRKKINIQVEE